MQGRTVNETNGCNDEVIAALKVFFYNVAIFNRAASTYELSVHSH